MPLSGNDPFLDTPYTTVRSSTSQFHCALLEDMGRGAYVHQLINHIENTSRPSFSLGHACDTTLVHSIDKGLRGYSFVQKTLELTFDSYRQHQVTLRFLLN